MFRKGCYITGDNGVSLPLFEPLFAGAPEPTGLPLTGADLRDAGIQQALDHLEAVKAEYIELCLSKIEELKLETVITSESLRELAGEPPIGCENAIAGILKRAASKKYRLIVNTGQEENAKRPSIHAKKLYRWRRIAKEQSEC